MAFRKFLAETATPVGGNRRWWSSASGSQRLSVFAGLRRSFVLLVLPFLFACVSIPSEQLAVADLSPLILDGQVITVEDAQRTAPTPDLLALDDDMRDFVATYAGKRNNQRQRLVNLHQSIKSPAILDIQYDPFAEGGAEETFHRGSANCLSYANMFVALAREAGLDARYQWLEVRPQWSRMGERVAVRLHVNVLVKTLNGDRFMVDIDPLSSNEITGSRVLSDLDAAALYHSNIAMGALAEEQLDTAWIQAVRALQLSPDTGHLWVNLGAIYRVAGQYEDAERSYFRALQLDHFDRSATNNLVVLYEYLGREEDHAYWSDRSRRYRDRNPYYHSWLGDLAGEAGDWPLALEHYQRAVKIMPDDSRLLYGLGIIYHQLGDFDSATEQISLAIERASLTREIEEYEIRLESVREDQLASF
ncbi:MAG: tetratricopeptide repeat protein [Halieaceae bacterium]